MARISAVFQGTVFQDNTYQDEAWGRPTFQKNVFQGEKKDKAFWQDNVFQDNVFLQTYDQGSVFDVQFAFVKVVNEALKIVNDSFQGSVFQPESFQTAEEVDLDPQILVGDS